MVDLLPTEASFNPIVRSSVNVFVRVARTKSGDTITPSQPLSNRQWALTPLMYQYPEMVRFSSWGLRGRDDERCRALWSYIGSADLSTTPAKARNSSVFVKEVELPSSM